MEAFETLFMGCLMGYKAAQPHWISVDDKQPPKEGDYYTIVEAQVEFPPEMHGTISVNVSDYWDGERWEFSDANWNVLFWAKPVRFDIPEVLSDRNRLGLL